MRDEHIKSKTKTVYKGKAIIKETGEEEEKMSWFVAIQAATPGLSLPYIRTMNEAFTKR